LIESQVDQSKIARCRSIDYKIDRSNSWGAGISETLANFINTILLSFFAKEMPLGSALGAVLTVVYVFFFSVDFDLELPYFVSFFHFNRSLLFIYALFSYV
jgi:hypothetical protein